MVRVLHSTLTPSPPQYHRCSLGASPSYSSSGPPSQLTGPIVPDTARIYLLGTVRGPSGRVARSAGHLDRFGSRHCRGRPKTPLLTGPEPGLRAWHGDCSDDMDEPCDAPGRPARRKSSLLLSSSSGRCASVSHPVWCRRSNLRPLSVRITCVGCHQHLRHAGAQPGVDSVTLYQPRAPSWLRRGNHHPDSTGTVSSHF